MHHLFRRVSDRLQSVLADRFWNAYTGIVGVGDSPTIRLAGDSARATPVDAYWTEHTVKAPQFKSALQSRRYIERRFNAYPKFRELSGLHGIHDNEIVLDYGCGPGNDLVGFALHTNARKIIGMDVSPVSLGFAGRRLALHRVDVDRIELWQLSDSSPSIPLADESVDFMSCQGVLQHTSHPDCIIQEWHRILKSGATACVMVYNRDSIKFHLHIAYQRMVLEGAFCGMTVEQAFSRSTDGPNCPIARCWRPEDFEEMCRSAGLSCDYRGGYFSKQELASLGRHFNQARNDERLGQEHREFLGKLVLDESGLPTYEGFWAGVGGVYFLHKS